MAFILRSHHLGNIAPKDIIPAAIRTCLTCALQNPPPAPKLIKAVKTTEAYREYSLDCTTFNEGNLAAVHGIILEGKWCTRGLAYVVTQCIITSWSGKDPTTHIRCDNGRAFTAEIIQIICATVHDTIVFIQAGNPNQNGVIEVAHKPFIGTTTSLLIQDPNMSYADAISMAVNMKNTQLYRPTGITPFEYEYARPPATFLATTLTEAPPPTADPNAIPARPLLIADQLALRHAIRKEVDEHRNHYQKEYNDTLLSGRK
eukprot:gene16673-19810_t